MSSRCPLGGCPLGSSEWGNLVHQNRTIAIASDFRVDGAKSPEMGSQHPSPNVKNRDAQSACFEGSKTKTVLQPASRLEKLMEGLLGSSGGGVRAEVSGRGPKLLRSCLGVEISIRKPSKAKF